MKLLMSFQFSGTLRSNKFIDNNNFQRGRRRRRRRREGEEEEEGEGRRKWKKRKGKSLADIRNH